MFIVKCVRPLTCSAFGAASEALAFDRDANRDAAESAAASSTAAVKAEPGAIDVVHCPVVSRRALFFEKKVTVTPPVDKVAVLKSIVEVSRIIDTNICADLLTRDSQDSLHHEIEALVGVKHGEAIVASLKEAAVAFLKRAKPLLLAPEPANATTAAAAAESGEKRKRDDELPENPEDARNRRRLERAQKAIAALTAEQERWSALESEQFGANELVASKRADSQRQAQQRAPTVLEDTRRLVAARRVPIDEARRAFESISMNVSRRATRQRATDLFSLMQLDAVLPLARDMAECAASVDAAQRSMAERVRAHGFAPFEQQSSDARVIVKKVAASEQPQQQ